MIVNNRQLRISLLREHADNPIFIQDEEANLFYIEKVTFVEETGAIHLVIGEEVK